MASKKFSKNEGCSSTTLIIGLAVLAIIVLGLYFLLGDSSKSEQYAISDLPPTACKVVTLPDQSADIIKSAQSSLANADPKIVANFYSALGNYTAQLASYNNLTTCSGICIGGTVNTSNGYCVCPPDSPIPYKWTDNNIYCISNDLSNLSGATVTFDPIKRQFACNSAYYNISGDNLCYNSSSKATIQNAMNTLNSAISNIQTQPAKIASVYGSIADPAINTTFYTAGQATAPTLTQPNGNATGVTSAVQAANSAPAGTNVFVYNITASRADYYKDSGVKISGLATGTTTVGSTSY